MKKQFVFCGIVMIFVVLSRFFVKANESKIDKSREFVTTDRGYILHYTRAEEASLEKEVKNLALRREAPSDKKRHRKIRRKKEKESKIDQPKNKLPKPVDYVDEQIQRNNEKLHLVRNRTIEILKNGLRILSTGESHAQANKKLIPRLHENLLEKILSSAAPKQEILYSASGINRITVGGKAFDPKLPPQAKDNPSGKRAMIAGITPMNTFSNEKDPIHLPRTQGQDGSFKEIYKNYDYEEYESTVEFKSNDLNKSHEAFLDYGHVSFDSKVGVLLERIVEALKNITTCSNDTCFKGNHDKDPCLKWLNCKESLSHAFVGENDHLPSCPCTYPSTIFYDDAIRDEKHKKYFRWRDASSEAERLDVYKPGASYCIRSLVTRGSSSVSSQQCCYDGKLLLLTRGSGAGTINFVSPDVSKKLHYIADILPWRLCKGDFTRYNEARTPNNGNNCPENPEQKQYRLQVQYSKNF